MNPVWECDEESLNISTSLMKDQPLARAQNYIDYQIINFGSIPLKPLVNVASF